MILDISYTEELQWHLAKNICVTNWEMGTNNGIECLGTSLYPPTLNLIPIKVVQLLACKLSNYTAIT